MYVCTSYLLYLVHECIHMKILHDTSHCRSQFPDIYMEVINAGLNGDHIFMRSRLYDDVLVNVSSRVSLYYVYMYIIFTTSFIMVIYVCMNE